MVNLSTRWNRTPHLHNFGSRANGILRATGSKGALLFLGNRVASFGPHPQHTRSTKGRNRGPISASLRPQSKAWVPMHCVAAASKSHRGRSTNTGWLRDPQRPRESITHLQLKAAGPPGPVLTNHDSHNPVGKNYISRNAPLRTQAQSWRSPLDAQAQWV